MNVILCGGLGEAPKFVWEQLMNRADVERVAVCTHPDTDRASGLSLLCEAYNVWHTTESINTATMPFEADVIISIYYKYIIEPHIIQSAKGKIFNAHASLLPRHRGRSAVPWAIVEDDTFSGVTYHYIDSGIDTGPIILQAAVLIDEDETQASLFDKINRAVGDYFPAAFALVKAGFAGAPQQGQGNYNSGGPPYGGEIDPNWPMGKIKRFIRAMNYPPYPPATFNGAEIWTLDNYRQQLFERWKQAQLETARNGSQPVSGRKRVH